MREPTAHPRSLPSPVAFPVVRPPERVYVVPGVQRVVPGRVLRVPDLAGLRASASVGVRRVELAASPFRITSSLSKLLDFFGCVFHMLLFGERNAQLCAARECPKAVPGQTGLCRGAPRRPWSCSAAGQRAASPSPMRRSGTSARSPLASGRWPGAYAVSACMNYSAVLSIQNCSEHPKEVQESASERPSVRATPESFSKVR